MVDRHVAILSSLKDGDNFEEWRSKLGVTRMRISAIRAEQYASVMRNWDLRIARCIDEVRYGKKYIINTCKWCTCTCSSVKF